MSQERFVSWVINVLYIVLAGGVLGHGWSVASLDPFHQVQYLPDDAYYYLTLVRNFLCRGPR